MVTAGAVPVQHDLVAVDVLLKANSPDAHTSHRTAEGGERWGYWARLGGDYHCPMATLLRRGVGKLTAMRSAMRSALHAEIDGLRRTLRVSDLQRISALTE